MLSGEVHVPLHRDCGTNTLPVLRSPSQGMTQSETEMIQCRKLVPASPLFNRDPAPFVSSPTTATGTTAAAQRPTGTAAVAEADAVVALCAEYDRQTQLERAARCAPAHQRIKTNGSLPRARRTSPLASPTSPTAFLFDHRDFTTDGSAKTYEPRSPNGYENVMIVSGSPRPRIKTIPSMDARDYGSENTENRIPLCLESDHSIDAVQWGIFQMEHPLSIAKIEDYTRRPSRAEVLADCKYNFLGFDPRKPADKVDSDKEPDYDTVDSGGSYGEGTKPSGEGAENLNSARTEQTCSDIETRTEKLNGVEEVVERPSQRECPIQRTAICNEIDSQRPDSILTEDSVGADVVDELQKEREVIVGRLAALKAKLSEIDLQEDELNREREMENALVEGEVSALAAQISECSARESRLRAAVAECDREMEKCRAEQERSAHTLATVQTSSAAIVTTLEEQLASCTDSDYKKEIQDSISQQMELLDAEKKGHEDLEFRLLEEETGWLSRKEELQRELSDLNGRLTSQKNRLASLIPPSTAHATIDASKVAHLRAIEQDRRKLKEINNELNRLTSGSFQDFEDSIGSSTTDEEIRDKSLDEDMQRISLIASTGSIDISSNSLGKKTIASLKEIERNRQLHIIKQGSQVIQEERARVEELKKRVQDQVKAQWELERNSRSLTSLNDEAARDSGLGSDELDKRASPDGKLLSLADLHVEGGDRSSPADSRPLSDASTCSKDDDFSGVKRRSKNNNLNLQRPLTRYLPVRGAEVDLRTHVAEAGHQAELCGDLSLDATSCRGYLLKLGARWPVWRRRWFVFDRSRRRLVYFTDRRERSLRGVAHFQAIEEVYVDHSNCVKSPSPKLTFVVRCSSRTFHLVAPSPEAMRIWVDVIFTGAEGYQQYSNH